VGGTASGGSLETAQLLSWTYRGQYFLLPGAVQRRVVSPSWLPVALAGFIMTSCLIAKLQHTHFLCYKMAKLPAVDSREANAPN